MLTTVVERIVVFCCSKKRKRLGFTFMELVFVLCAIVALSTGAFIVGNNVLQNGRYNAARSDVAAISLAVSQYHFEMEAWPANLDALATAQGQYGPWLDTDGLTDPWGNGYNYALGANNTFAIWSNGENRTNDSSEGNAVPAAFASDDIGYFGH